jgi:hypothetical protein
VTERKCGFFRQDRYALSILIHITFMVLNVFSYCIMKLMIAYPEHMGCPDDSPNKTAMPSSTSGAIAETGPND